MTIYQHRQSLHSQIMIMLKFYLVTALTMSYQALHNLQLQCPLHLESSFPRYVYGSLGRQRPLIEKSCQNVDGHPSSSQRIMVLGAVFLEQIFSTCRMWKKRQILRSSRSKSQPLFSVEIRWMTSWEFLWYSLRNFQKSSLNSNVYKSL